MASMGFMGANTEKLYAPNDIWLSRLRRLPHARGVGIFALLTASALSLIVSAGLLALRQTDGVEERAQQTLRRQFLASLAAAPVPLVAPPATEGTVPVPVQFLPEPPRPVPGGPIALIRIPSIGVDKVVVEGTGDDQLSQGPGHYPSTAMPGEGGTFAVAAHRLIYGAPFFSLDRLKPGSRISVVTAEGGFVYRVTRRETVPASSNRALMQTVRDQERLVLTTTARSLKGDKRLVVTAVLEDRGKRTTARVQLPADNWEAPPPEPVVEEFGLSPLGRLAATNVTPRTAQPPPKPAEAAPPPPPPPTPPPPPAPAPAAAPAPAPAPSPEAAPPPPPPPAPEPRANTSPAIVASEPSPAPSGPLHRAPNRFAPACRNGIDDDGDGAIDFRSLDGFRQDRACNGENDEEE